MAKLRFNRQFDISHIVKRLVYTVLLLYAGGTIITTLGDVMNGTASAFYSGLTLIGWTVSTTAVGCPTNALPNCITATTGAGVLSVVGVIGIASIVMEFVTWN